MIPVFGQPSSDKTIDAIAPGLAVSPCLSDVPSLANILWSLSRPDGLLSPKLSRFLCWCISKRGKNVLRSTYIGSWTRCGLTLIASSSSVVVSGLESGSRGDIVALLAVTSIILLNVYSYCETILLYISRCILEYDKQAKPSELYIGPFYLRGTGGYSCNFLSSRDPKLLLPILMLSRVLVEINLGNPATSWRSSDVVAEPPPGLPLLSESLAFFSSPLMTPECYSCDQYMIF